MAYQADIITDLLRNAKLYGQDYLVEIYALKDAGEDVRDEKIRYIVLIRLIQALERYYNANFDSQGNKREEPTETCLDEDYYDKLVRKLKQMIGNAQYAASDWILAEGVWNDAGYFRDQAHWTDS